MTAGIYDITCEQGATFTRTLTWSDENGALVDLTGYTARMDVRAPTTNTLQISLTTENSRITLGGVAGTITLSISATDTNALTTGLYLYDLEMVSGATITRLVQGSFTVSPQVTA